MKNNKYNWFDYHYEDDNDYFPRWKWTTTYGVSNSAPKTWELKDGKYSVSYNVPGYGIDDIKVEQDSELGTVYFSLKEVKYELLLPENSDFDIDVEVTVDKGVLTFVIPERKSKRKIIKVK